VLFYVATVLIPGIIGELSGYRPFGGNLQQSFIYNLFTLESFYYNYLSFGLSLDALANFRNLLHLSRDKFQKLEYEFSVLPVSRVNTLTVIALVASIGLAYVSPDLFGISVPMSLGYLVSQTLSWFFSLFGALILVYRLIHQVRKVEKIYDLVRKIDLYNLGPIYSLSSFMAKASLILLFILYSNLVSDPSNLEISGFIQGSIVISIIALAGFIWPLLGINRRLVEAKAELMQESGMQVRAAFDRLGSEQKSKNLARIVNTRQLIDAVTKKREYIQNIPTWPWQAGTFRNVLLGVFLPIFIWIIQQVLERTLIK
jgi:hypothetical protein